MKKLHVVWLLFAAVLLAACDGPLQGARYQLQPSTDGKAYRLDTKTGLVHLVTSEGLLAIEDRSIKLKQGTNYETEDGHFVKYVGSGQFEKGIDRKRLEREALEALRRK